MRTHGLQPVLVHVEQNVSIGAVRRGIRPTQAIANACFEVSERLHETGSRIRALRRPNLGATIMGEHTVEGHCLVAL